MNLNLKCLTCIVLFVSCINNIHGQNKVRGLHSSEKTSKDKKSTYDSKYHLKVYYNFTHRNNDKEYYYEEINQLTDINHTENNFGRVSAAFIIKNKKSFHEFELTRINFDKQESSTYIHKLSSDSVQITAGATSYVFNLNLKYEYNYQLANLKNKLQLYIGAAAEPYYQFNMRTPILETSFRTRYHTLGCKMYITPRITYDFSKRFYFDLNFPFEFANFYWEQNHIENPTLPANLQKSSTTNAIYFEKIFQFRFGVGFKI